MVNLMHLDLVNKVAVSAAYRSAAILRSRFGKPPAFTRKKSAAELVTEADEASEKAIIETIRAAFPGHAILSEESGLNTGDTACQWIVDPLDGTNNFAHHLAIFSISIAFALDGEVAVGVILSPMTQELFCALKDNGAELNGRPIRVSNRERVSDSLLVTGFPYDIGAKEQPMLCRLFKCMKVSQGVRRLGSAAIDLCYVACGRFDAFWEVDLNPWDAAAGILIAREAGARVTDFSGQSHMLEKKELLASNDHIHDEMLTLLRCEENK